MKHPRKKAVTEKCGSSSSDVGFLLSIVFRRSLPLWDRYGGEVPAEELEKLDQLGDWPAGMAAAAIKRLSRDKRLREQIRKRVD